MATSAASYFLLKSAGSSVSGSSFLISQERSVFDLELPCTLMPWCDWHPDVLLAPVAAGRSGCAVSLGEPATAAASVSFSESYREASEFARCSTCSRCTDWFTNRSTLILKNNTKQHKTIFCIAEQVLPHALNFIRWLWCWWGLMCNRRSLTCHGV